jgi:hypothetical protein
VAEVIWEDWTQDWIGIVTRLYGIDIMSTVGDEGIMGNRMINRFNLDDELIGGEDRKMMNGGRRLDTADRMTMNGGRMDTDYMMDDVDYP